MSIDTGDILRVVVTWAGPLVNTLQNVWHYKVATGTDLAAAAILTAIDAWYDQAFDDIAAYHHEDVSVTLWDLLQWDFANHRWDGVGQQAPSTIVGTNNSDQLVQGVGMLGRVVTEAARRQGRHYPPGLVETSTDGDVLTTLAEAALATFMTDFDTALSPVGGTLTWCTFNTEPLSPLYETESLAIQTVIANSLCGYQRRRKPGVGI